MKPASTEPFVGDACDPLAPPASDYIALAYLHPWARATLAWKRDAEAGHGWTAQVYGPGVRAFVRADADATRLVRYRCRQTPYDYPRELWPTWLAEWVATARLTMPGAKVDLSPGPSPSQGEGSKTVPRGLCIEVIVGAEMWPVDVLEWGGRSLREGAWSERRAALDVVARGWPQLDATRLPHPLPDDEWIAQQRVDGHSLVLKAPDAPYGDGSSREPAGLWIPPLGRAELPDNEPHPSEAEAAPEPVNARGDA